MCFSKSPLELNTPDLVGLMFLNVLLADVKLGMEGTCAVILTKATETPQVIFVNMRKSAGERMLLWLLMLLVMLMWLVKC